MGTYKYFALVRMSCKLEIDSFRFQHFRKVMAIINISYKAYKSFFGVEMKPALKFLTQE